MKGHIRILCALVLTFIGINSCSTDKITPDGKLIRQQFVDVGGAVLPVLVAGKNSSDIAIVFVHGGPGFSSQLFRRQRGLFDIESEYKMIYYDQRASGMTQGNSGVNDITIEQFSGDLDVIVDFVREVVGASQIYIMGHSWGGGLSTYYLLDDLHRDKIQGYIAVAPAFDLVKAMDNSRNVMIAVATALVDLGVRTQYWQGALDFYNSHPVITQENFDDHLKYVDAANGINFTEPQLVNIDLPDFQLQAFTQNLVYTNQHMTIGGEPVFESLDLSDQMSQITLPTLLLWGSKDGLVPVGQNTEFHESIGTPDAQFFYVEFPISAHEPMGEEPDLFKARVVEFVEQTR